VVPGAAQPWSNPSHGRTVTDLSLPVVVDSIPHTLARAVAHHQGRPAGNTAGPEVPDDSPAPARRALLGSVDVCLLGTTLPRQSEASPSRLPSQLGRGPAEGILPLRGLDDTLRERSGARPRCGGRPLGKLSGGNRMAGRPCRSIAPGTRPVGGYGPPQDIALPRSRGVSSRYCRGVQDSYLVDSASSHMLVSKIKPCMSKYKQSIR
jgi:hypothetical protein